MRKGITVAALAMVCAGMGTVHGSGSTRALPRVPETPPEAVRFHAVQIARVQPSVRAWISGEAKKVRQSPDAVSEASLAAAVRSRFAGQHPTERDVMALLALVATEAAQDAERDLRAMADKQKALLDAKQKIRAAQTTLARQLAASAGRPDSERCAPPLCGALGLATTADAARNAGLRVTLPTKEPATVGELTSAADTMKSHLDSMSEMGETESLRLQMAMDRLSKLMSTLSNILKKISDTSQSITQNLK